MAAAEYEGVRKERTWKRVTPYTMYLLQVLTYVQRSFERWNYVAVRICTSDDILLLSYLVLVYTVYQKLLRGSRIEGIINEHK